MEKIKKGDFVLLNEKFYHEGFGYFGKDFNRPKDQMKPLEVIDATGFLCKKEQVITIKWGGEEHFVSSIFVKILSENN